MWQSNYFLFHACDYMLQRLQIHPAKTLFQYYKQSETGHGYLAAPLAVFLVLGWLHDVSSKVRVQVTQMSYRTYDVVESDW